MRTEPHTSGQFRYFGDYNGEILKSDKRLAFIWFILVKVKPTATESKKYH